MKRTNPYSGPGAQAQGAPPPAYGQPPPPAGPAPPLPASGPSQTAYANYGYGSVAPSRHAATPLNSAGANDVQQHQWNQQWPQPQQQQYYPQQQQQQQQQQPNAVGAPGIGQFAAPRPPSQSGPYRGAPAPSAQNAAYSPHQPQQPVSYSYQPQAPLQQQQHQPSAPPNYGFAPSMPPHQHVAPSSAANSITQNWPGAYAPGNQGGPPSKKPRYQASPNLVASPAAPYGPTGGAPVAPVGMNAPGIAMNQYSPQQQYGWQGPNAPPAPPMNPQPVLGHPAQHGRVPSGSGMHANAPGHGASFALPARSDKGAKGMGSVAAANGRGVSRNGAQNRGILPQGPPSQRAGLPANPTASVNSARAPHGQTRAWGSKALADSVNDGGTGIQVGRRVSSASSVHSDKNAAGGSARKLNPSSQGMIPPDAPRGPNNVRNKTATGVSAASSQTLKNGDAAAAQGARGPRVGSKIAGPTGSSSGDVVEVKGIAASSKRAHTDFRILGLEIKQLDWSWFASQAMAEDAEAPPNPSEVLKQSDAATSGAAAQSASTPVENYSAEAEPAEAKNSAQDDKRSNDQAKETEDQPAADDEHANEERQDHDEENLDHNEEASDAEDDADQDNDVDADADGDGDQDADGDLDADAEEDVTMSHADTDTVASEQQHSVAPTPEPSSESSKAAKPATQPGKASKAERARTLASMRDSTKLRFCFAAMSNAGPEGAPTGPKSAKIQEAKVEAESDVQDESSADQSEVVVREASTEESHAEGEGSVEVATKESVPESKEDSMPEGKESEVQVASDDVQPEVASSLRQSQPVQPVEEAAAAAVDRHIGTKEEAPVKAEEQANEEKDAKKADNDPTASKGKKLRSATDSEPPAKGPPQLSMNRIFLSFAANRKRLAIDAEAVKSVKIHRSEHWIEIRIDASRQADQAAPRKGEGYLVCRGTLLEKRTKGQENYTAVTRSHIAAAWETAATDSKLPGTELADDEHLELPPFFRLDDASTDLVLQVHLDPSAPLPEPAWLRTNDMHELLASLQRGSSAIAGKSETAVSVGTAQHVWAGKIEVLDPDPPPSMSTLLSEWVRESFIGSQRERRKFVDELLGKKGKVRKAAGEGKEGLAQVKVEGGEEAEAEAEMITVAGEKGTKVEGDERDAEGEEEADAERDARVARAFVEIVLRLIKGERVPSTFSEGSSFAQALTSVSYTSSATYPGLFMLGLLDLALHDPASAARVRAQVDGLLMEMPRAMVVKALDLTWKDVMEGGRKGGSAGGGAGVGRGGVQRNQHRHQQQQGQERGRHHHHQHHRAGGGGGGGAGHMHPGGARHGKRKRG
ncbi:hypothetical protein EX895_002719 [Sporisorium graminicola]|uniref:Uncharacterized protein n=1 Tax=Sporisorium graminicola TaxID=280036 RepID=A0A4U7KW28_9BASI|nr:hypothetical protein EX895_002719 [Sporisorium graminicola]TKY88367.1 hypothetical protein EX895_002719 [Sporisorium graminicola]